MRKGVYWVVTGHFTCGRLGQKRMPPLCNLLGRRRLRPATQSANCAATHNCVFLEGVASGIIGGSPGAFQVSNEVGGSTVAKNANKQPSKSGKAPSAAAAKIKSSPELARPKSTKSSADAKGATGPSSFTGIAIGHAAGDVWGFLSNADGGQTVAAVKKAVGAPPDLVAAALGWLAREDKLTFDTSGRTVKISLK